MTPSGGPLGGIEQCGKHQVYHHHHKNGDDYGSGRRLSHFFCARSRGKALLAANRGDHQPKHDALHQSRHDISEDQSVTGCAHVAGKGEVGSKHAKKTAAEHTHEVGPNHETGQHQSHRQKLRSHKEGHRIQGHGSSASSSSVTRMVAISAAKADPDRPMTTIAVISGPSSRVTEIATRLATSCIAPSVRNSYAPCSARITPMKNAIREIIGTAPTPPSF